MTRLPVHAIVGTLLICVTLGACVHSGKAQTTDKERSPMTTPTEENPADTPVAKPTLSADQMLTRLLELIRTSRSIQEFTPERLHEVMGVNIEYAKDGSGRYGFGEKVAMHWNQGFEIDMERSHGARFHFSFDPMIPSQTPDMTAICQIDFEQFSAKLESIGFSRQSQYGSHGSHVKDTFDRPGMRVEVYPRGEANAPLEKINHLCVKMVLVR